MLYLNVNLSAYTKLKQNFMDNLKNDIIIKLTSPQGRFKMLEINCSYVALKILSYSHKLKQSKTRFCRCRRQWTYL